MKRSVVLLAALIAMLCFSVGLSFAQDEEEVKKPPIDLKLFDEFFALMKNYHTNAQFSSKTKNKRNGAEVVVKYDQRFKDLEHHIEDSDYYAQKATECVTPGDIWVYFPKDDDLVYYADKKTLEKRNFKLYLESFKNNGKITKKVRDGQTAYTLVNSDGSLKVIYYFDDATKNLVMCREYDGNGELGSESTYYGRQNKSMSMADFKRPYSTTTRKGD